MKTRIEEYLRHIESIAGEGRYFTVTDKFERPSVSVILFDDVPEEGVITSFTYGLSLFSHKEWLNGKPELLVSVKSDDDAWALAMGECVRRNGLTDLFSVGTVLNFGNQISEESGMSSFLIFFNSLLNQEDACINLQGDRINFVQLYPIYAEESELIRRIGPQRFFFDLGIDFSDVKRQPEML